MRRELGPRLEDCPRVELGPRLDVRGAWHQSVPGAASAAARTLHAYPYPYGRPLDFEVNMGLRTRAAWNSEQGCSSHAPMGRTHVGRCIQLNSALCISSGGTVFKFNFAFFISSGLLLKRRRR